jgi:hypothetical protein
MGLFTTSMLVDGYSSRKVFAGSIPAIRRVGMVVAIRVTSARVATTVTMVVAS